MLNTAKRLLPLICFMYAAPAPAVVDMFMRIPGVPGESQAPGHEGDIDVLGWRSDIVIPSVISRGSAGAGRGKPGTGSITIRKVVDSTSTVLFDNCCNGKHFDTATLTVRKADGAMVEYIILEFTALSIGRIETFDPIADPAGEDRLTENVTFNYRSLKANYVPQEPDGSQGAPVDFEWDAANQAGK